MHIAAASNFDMTAVAIEKIQTGFHSPEIAAAGTPTAAERVEQTFEGSEPDPTTPHFQKPRQAG